MRCPDGRSAGDFGLVHTSCCVVFLGILALSLCHCHVRWGKHNCTMVWWGLRCAVGVCGCPPLLLSPAYYETRGSHKDTEVAAVDRPRSQALRSLERNQPHNSLALDSSLQTLETALPDCGRVKHTGRAGAWYPFIGAGTVPLGVSL